MTFFLVSRIALLRNNNNVKASDKTIIKEKFWIDYLSFSSFLLLKPRTSRQYAFKTIWKNSMAGILLAIAGIWTGFIMTTYYQKTLLSFLTVPSYGKPIKTIPGEYLSLLMKSHAIISSSSYLDLLETNLTVFILDEDIFHIMASDPRKDFRDLYLSDQTEIYQYDRLAEVQQTDQATVFERKITTRGLTLKILDGQPPDRQQLDETYMLGVCAHFLRVNDVLSESFNTYLAQMMDSGIVARIYGKYYLSDGKTSMFQRFMIYKFS